MYCDIRRSWSLQLVKWKLVDQYYSAFDKWHVENITKPFKLITGKKDVLQLFGIVPNRQAGFQIFSVALV